MEAWRIEKTLFTLTLLLAFTAASGSSAARADATAGFKFDLASERSESLLQPTNAAPIAHLEALNATVHGITPDQVYLVWVSVRAKAIAPALQVVVWMCMVMSVMLVVEATYMALVSLGVKVIGWRPEKQHKWEAIGEDEEKGTSAYPTVLVQIPMYNEIEVCGIGALSICFRMEEWQLHNPCLFILFDYFVIFY